MYEIEKRLQSKLCQGNAAVLGWVSAVLLRAPSNQASWSFHSQPSIPLDSAPTKNLHGSRKERRDWPSRMSISPSTRPGSWQDTHPLLTIVPVPQGTSVPLEAACTVVHLRVSPTNKSTRLPQLFYQNTLVSYHPNGHRHQNAVICDGQRQMEEGLAAIDDQSSQRRWSCNSAKSHDFYNRYV